MSGEVRLFRRCRTSGRDPVPWGDSSCYGGCGCKEYIAIPAAKHAALMRVVEETRALLRVVDERERGLSGYYIDAKRFSDIRVALNATAPERRGEAPRA